MGLIFLRLAVCFEIVSPLVVDLLFALCQHGLRRQDSFEGELLVFFGLLGFSLVLGWRAGTADDGLNLGYIFGLD